MQCNFVMAIKLPGLAEIRMQTANPRSTVIKLRNLSHALFKYAHTRGDSTPKCNVRLHLALVSIKPRVTLSSIC